VPTWHLIGTACASAARRQDLRGVEISRRRGAQIPASRLRPLPAESEGRHLIFRVVSSFEVTVAARLLCVAGCGRRRARDEKMTPDPPAVHCCTVGPAQASRRAAACGGPERRRSSAAPAAAPSSSYAPSSFRRQPEPKKLSARRKSFTFPAVIGHQLISDFRPKRSMTTLCCAQNLRMPPGPWR